MRILGYMSPPLLTPEEVQSQLSITARQLVSLRERREIRWVRVGRSARFHQKDVDEFLAKRTVEKR